MEIRHLVEKKEGQKKDESLVDLISNIETKSEEDNQRLMQLRERLKNVDSANNGVKQYQDQTNSLKQFQDPINKLASSRQHQHAAPTKKDGTSSLQDLFESTALPWKSFNTLNSATKFNGPTSYPKGTPRGHSVALKANSILHQTNKALDKRKPEMAAAQWMNTKTPTVKKPIECMGKTINAGSSLDTFVSSKKCNDQDIFDKVVKMLGPSEPEFQSAENQYADTTLLHQGMFNDMSGMVKRDKTPRRTTNKLSPKVS